MSLYTDYNSFTIYIIEWQNTYDELEKCNSPNHGYFIELPTCQLHLNFFHYVVIHTPGYLTKRIYEIIGPFLLVVIGH